MKAMICVAAALMSVSTLPALAKHTTDAVAILSTELKALAPPQWQVRVRWRENQLLAPVTPLPYDLAFQLWYEPEKLQKALTGMCPNLNAEIWSLIGADQDVILEPTVGGKSGIDLRVSCRAAGAAT